MFEKQQATFWRRTLHWSHTSNDQKIRPMASTSTTTANFGMTRRAAVRRPISGMGQSYSNGLVRALPLWPDQRISIDRLRASASGRFCCKSRQ